MDREREMAYVSLYRVPCERQAVGVARAVRLLRGGVVFVLDLMLEIDKQVFRPLQRYTVR